MDRQARGWTTLGSLILGALIGSAATVVWIFGRFRRAAAREVARARLWPRPDGSVRSFGEVWDIPSGPPHPYDPGD